MCESRWLAEVDALIACARDNQRILFEAFKTACLLNFLLLRNRCLKIGRMHKAFPKLLPVLFTLSALSER